MSTRSADWRLLLLIPAAWAVLSGSGCAPVERAPAGAGPAGGSVVEVRANTQATVGRLRIGLGYTRTAEIAEASGARRRGLVAGLWIFAKPEAGKDRKLEVHVGERVDVDGYSIFVEEIRGGRGDSVRLRIQEPAQPS